MWASLSREPQSFLRGQDDDRDAFNRVCRKSDVRRGGLDPKSYVEPYNEVWHSKSAK